jgi:hypothetical protein
VERGQQSSSKTRKTADPHRVRGIISFCAGAVLLLDFFLYVAARLVIAYLARTSGYGSAWELALAERILILYAGSIPALILGCLLSWGVLRALHLGRARPSTRWILGCSISLGLVTTLLAAWIVWSGSSLRLPFSLFKELTKEFVAAFDYTYVVPVPNLSDNWSLVPVLSAAFLACSLIAVVVRAVYVRLFERH